jgi:antitoxin component of RelBE/YafQ-DinJ toxin-antitoxin module
MAARQGVRMKNTRIFVRMTDADKAAAQAVADSRGLTLSEMLRSYLAKVVRQSNKGAKQ